MDWYSYIILLLQLSTQSGFYYNPRSLTYSCDTFSCSYWATPGSVLCPGYFTTQTGVENDWTTHSTSRAWWLVSDCLQTSRYLPGLLIFSCGFSVVQQLISQQLPATSSNHSPAGPLNGGCQMVTNQSQDLCDWDQNPTLGFHSAR